MRAYLTIIFVVLLATLIIGFAQQPGIITGSGVGGGGGGGTGNAAAYTTVTFSATPTFTCNTNTANSFLITLTGNVTSSTLASCTTGQIITFTVCQDATGGRTFVPPTNVQNMGTIDATASVCSVQTFVYDGTNAQMLGTMGLTGTASGEVHLFGSTSGFAKLIAAAVAGGTQTFPNGTGSVALITGSPANNDCAKIVVSGSTYTLASAGAACGSGGGGVTLNLPITFGSCRSVTTDSTVYPGMWSSDQQTTSHPALACSATGLADGSATLPRLAFSNSTDESLYFQFTVPASYTSGAATLVIPSYHGTGTGDVKWQVGACAMAVGAGSACSYNNATAISSQGTAFQLKVTTVTLDTTGWAAGKVVNLKWTRSNACSGCSNGNMADIEYVFNPPTLTVN